MNIHSIIVKNYGPFKTLEEMKLGQLATIIGKNDVGKSYILQAMQVFFGGRKIDIDDVHNGANQDDEVAIEIAFSSLPDNLELEEGVQTTFQEENLVDAGGHLRIRKSFSCNNLKKFSVTIIVNDYEDNQYAALATLKEKELNERCKSAGIEVSQSGRGITNKSKRDALRQKAQAEGIHLISREIELPQTGDLWKKIKSMLPEFVLFETDTKLGVGETAFQSQFRPIVKNAATQPDVVEHRDAFTASIESALQGEVDKIFERLKKYTDTFGKLRVKPLFLWDKAVTFDVLGEDNFGVETSLERRGSGLRRLLMVAFFQYLAEKNNSTTTNNYIYAVEEPENCLHPGLQRELVYSFRELADDGYQIIVTSHSPVFAGAAPLDDLALVMRNAGLAKAVQVPELHLSDIAEELGIEPSDQITGYNACVFVEGPSDVLFWKTIATKFKEAGFIEIDFDDAKIGFVMHGGETLKHWIDLRAMQRLNRHFGVVIDSDRKRQEDNIPGRKLNWKRKCEEQGGQFHILRKREIENYLHPDAIARSNRRLQYYDGFSDMKSLFGEKVYKVITDMSCDEILEMDAYDSDGEERHELLEIVQHLLSLPD